MSSFVLAHMPEDELPAPGPSALVLPSAFTTAFRHLERGQVDVRMVEPVDKLNGYGKLQRRVLVLTGSFLAVCTVDGEVRRFIRLRTIGKLAALQVDPSSAKPMGSPFGRAGSVREAIALRIPNAYDMLFLTSSEGGFVRPSDSAAANDEGGDIEIPVLARLLASAARRDGADELVLEPWKSSASAPDRPPLTLEDATAAFSLRRPEGLLDEDCISYETAPKITPRALKRQRYTSIMGGGNAGGLGFDGALADQLLLSEDEAADTDGGDDAIHTEEDEATPAEEINDDLLDSPTGLTPPNMDSDDDLPPPLGVAFGMVLPPAPTATKTKSRSATVLHTDPVPTHAQQQQQVRARAMTRKDSGQGTTGASQASGRARACTLTAQGTHSSSYGVEPAGRHRGLSDARNSDALAMENATLRRRIAELELEVDYWRTAARTNTRGSICGESSSSMAFDLGGSMTISDNLSPRSAAREGIL